MTRYVYQFSFWSRDHEELDLLDIVAESLAKARHLFHEKTAGMDCDSPKLECIKVHEHILNCPACDTRHIDEGEGAQRLHRTHQCQNCGRVWTPFSYYTVGV